MGYGHQRAIYPLREIAEDGIITVGDNDSISPAERKSWRRMLLVYESLSRASTIPVIGKPLFKIMDVLLKIPSLYPFRDLSRPTFQVNHLESSIAKGLCKGMLDKVITKRLPLVTSFFAPAVAADLAGLESIYCIVCDSDINRVWAAKNPDESRINYFSPCGRATRRLKLYGVPAERIFTTGFPLPEELLGGPDLPALKHNLAIRLKVLDPKNRFSAIQGKSVEYYLGDISSDRPARPLTVTYAVGGAGAQKETASRILHSLKDKLISGELNINLVAGTKKPVFDYFTSIVNSIAPGLPNVRIIYDSQLDAYISKFNRILHDTDILWTKPSELSFYSALGIPIIIAPPIGSHERHNSIWLREIHAGIKQLDPDHTADWLFDFVSRGRFAELAWSGFLKGRKLGTYKIKEILETGIMKTGESPLER